MTHQLQSNLANVQSLLRQLTEAWDRPGGPVAGVAMNLAEPLQQLSSQPEFERSFRARFREMFEGANEMAGMEALCHRLAPACTWCMLFVMADLSAAEARR